jgi:nicotinic acid mononucleotide adenylyltransferase
MPKNTTKHDPGSGDEISRSSDKVTDVVFTFGRFQPPTTGHKLLFDEVASRANETTDTYIFVSSNITDRKKNPLTAAEKIVFLEKMYPTTPVRIINTDRTKIKGQRDQLLTLRKVYGPEIKIRYIVGRDPTQKFDWLEQIARREGIHFTIEVIDRDLEGISGTKMRNAARGKTEKNAKNFAEGVTIGDMTSNNVGTLRELLKRTRGGARTKKLKHRRSGH